MCGIFLSVGFQASQSAIECVAHRGPDALNWHEEEFELSPIVLGHARLKIFDLSDDANQPFNSSNGRYSLIFNGAIYNYIELRELLEIRGYVFQTQSDTEVLLAAFMQWDAECLPRLMGMFAFVIWDRETGRIFAARDRYGIKPLYFTAEPGKIALASEIKQLLTVKTTPNTLNIEAAYDFLEGGLTDHMQTTLFEGVFHIRGGEYLDIICTEIPAHPKVIPWHILNTHSFTQKNTAELFSGLFEKSIARHLRSDVTVGSCLSGGLDSSSIVLRADKYLEDGFETFTAGFKNSPLDESSYAQGVIAKTKNAQFNSVSPNPTELSNIIENLICVHDEPFGSTGIYAQWCVFKAAKGKNVKVMLDGQGADEILAGYHAAFPIYFADLMATFKWITVFKALRFRHIQGGDAISEAMSGLKILLRRFGGQQFKQIYRGLLRRRRAQGHWLDTALFAPIFESGRDDIVKAACKREGLSHIGSIRNLCHLMVRSTSLPRLLRFEDRNSMAHSIEARVPFLDNELSDFVLKLPAQFKINNGETKAVLRTAMSDLPSSVLNRTDKLGFSTPQDEWLRGDLKKIAKASLTDLHDRFPTILTFKAQTQLLASLESQSFDTSRLWRVMIFSLWTKLYNIKLPSR